MQNEYDIKKVMEEIELQLIASMKRTLWSHKEDEKAVDTMYGDSLTKEEKEEEVKRLKEEQGIIEKDEPTIV